MNAFLGAVVLAGGRASRLGGTTKPQLTLAGATLLDRTIDAADAVGAASVVVVGPPPEDARQDVRWVREEPAFAGPAAAIVAGLAATDPADDPEWTLLLASDLVFPDAVAPRLVGDVPLLPSDTEGLCLGDGSSRPQWLAGVYRTAALRRAAATAADWRDAPVRALLDDLAIAVVRAPDGVVRDIDTWQDLDDARRLRGDLDPDTAKKETPMTEHLPPEALDDWAEAVRVQLGLGPEDLPIAVILDLAGEVARGVARPAAPLSAFAAGLAAGRTGGSPEQVRDAVAQLARLANGWQR